MKSIEEALKAAIEAQSADEKYARKMEVIRLASERQVAFYQRCPPYKRQ